MAYDRLSKLERIRRLKPALKGALEHCSICPRRCNAQRTKGRLGYCRAGSNPAVYSYSAHYGEEPPLSGTKGSGTIFFSHCNMRCAYCQNYYFSQLDNGEEVSLDALSRMMLYLQKIGCHNINLVSPTHFVPQIIGSLESALEGGLEIPIVYNTGGYDSSETLKMLEGIVDIYMPDMRYADDKMALNYSDAPDYVERNRESIIEMHRQVGDLVMGSNGVAEKGLIIRLLVLPSGISGTRDSLKYIAEEISKNTYLSIMSQYYPTFKAYNYSELSRPINPAEYKNVVDEAVLLGLNNGWIQEKPVGFDPKFKGTNIPPKKDIL